MDLYLHYLYFIIYLFWHPHSFENNARQMFGTNLTSGRTTVFESGQISGLSCVLGGVRSSD